MSSSVTISRTRPAGRVLVLLILVVIGGVLGMHALAPGGGLPDGHTGAGHMTAAVQPAAHGADTDCSHPPGGAGHLHHADAACAAAGTASAYTPPALGAAPAHTTAPALRTGAAAADRNHRAPPDLSALQLLRI
ncbi:DUF6153 family protein [Streptomyces cinereospinus]|uniref:DUF6153 family protein n=1 Tax=Streptomyces cinereospinus TaxID=285561 RepID=A0ABV5NA69_9ACTN